MDDEKYVSDLELTAARYEFAVFFLLDMFGVPKEKIPNLCAEDSFGDLSDEEANEVMEKVEAALDTAVTEELPK